MHILYFLILLESCYTGFIFIWMGVCTTSYEFLNYRKNALGYKPFSGEKWVLHSKRLFWRPQEKYSRVHNCDYHLILHLKSIIAYTIYIRSWILKLQCIYTIRCSDRVSIIYTYLKEIRNFRSWIYIILYQIHLCLWQYPEKTKLC